MGMTAPIRSPIERFMTPDPICVASDTLLSSAMVHMRRHDIRHLPVVDGGRLIGILSQRDIAMATAEADQWPPSEHVGDAMSREVYAVPPERPLGEVAAKMVERKYGCTVVTRDERVVGIFTTTDALRLLVGIVEAWL
jgi:acetoin utilization protein AcuB